MDEELERLKRRRMLEIRRKLIQKSEKSKDEKIQKEPTSKEVLDSVFFGRAWEVYNAAKTQFPSVMPQVENALVGGIKSGKIKNKIDGESLFVFLRQLGLQVRLQTSIRYKEHGELKTIGQLMKEK